MPYKTGGWGEQAKARYEKRYNRKIGECKMGRPFKKDGVPITNREAVKRYNERNPGKKAKALRKKRAANRDFFNEYARFQYKKNIEKVKMQKAKRWQIYRLAVITKMGGECVRCGFSDYRALQIDHINGGGVREIREKGQYHSSKEILKGNTDKYQLLCANCNWIKRYENKEVGGN